MSLRKALDEQLSTMDVDGRGAVVELCRSLADALDAGLEDKLVREYRLALGMLFQPDDESPVDRSLAEVYEEFEKRASERESR